MNNHDKKKIAPIIITVIIILYYGIYFGIMMVYIKGALKILLGIVPAVVAGAMIYVCVQRIKEIEGGEEDDLSQY